MPSGTTSRPMPSPGMTAMRMRLLAVLAFDAAIAVRPYVDCRPPLNIAGPPGQWPPVVLRRARLRQCWLPSYQATEGGRMKLWLRLLWVLLAAPWRSRLDARTGVSRLAFRVLPHDLDANLHMNNGRYLTIMDLGRIDFVLRSGLWRPMWRNSWAPIASAVVIRFRRELRPFEAYWLETRVVAWSDTTAVMEQPSLPRHGGPVAAHALMKAGFYDRASRSFVTVKRLIAALGVPEAEAESPAPSPEVEAFLKAESALRRPATE